MADKVVQPISLRTTKPPPYTVEADGFQKITGETIPRRHPSAKDGLIMRPEPGVGTIYDILKRGKAVFGDANAIGSRPLVKTHTEVKKITNASGETVEKTWTYSELGPYQYMSFNALEKLTSQVGAGLRKLGMTAGDRLHIYAATSVNWFAMAHGAATQSLPIVTAYDTLGESGLEHSLCRTKSKAIFLDAYLLPKLRKLLKKATDVKILIYKDSGAGFKQEHVDELRKEYPHLAIHTFEELTSLGEDNPVDDVPPSPEDLCCIMYTSGSTGPPKGVLLKHSNIVAAVAGANGVVGPYIGRDDRFLGYLPLAHIIEFVFENASLYWGGTIGYANPRSLTDASVRNCKGDMREFQPTIMVGVPAIWESVRKGVLSRVTPSFIVRNVFNTGLFFKNMLVATGLPGSGILDSVVFSKVKEATGGRLRLVMNGAGMVAKDTHRFISMAICPMILGYGLTETCGMGTLNDPAAWTVEALGTIPTSTEIKLVDVPGLGYFTSRADGANAQGEIWIRGGSVTGGYLDGENASDFTADGWFKTGDIGEFNETGQLRIIDRKKNLVKTLNGEYIALEKLESIYRTSPLVTNICIHASPTHAKPLAIIVPTDASLSALAARHNIHGTRATLLQDPKVAAIVAKEMQGTGRAGGLVGIEIIDGVVMADEEWTPQNGFTTNAQKINRKGILEAYRSEVDKILARS